MSGSPLLRRYAKPDTMAPFVSAYIRINRTGMAHGHEPHVHPHSLEICCILRGLMDWWAGEHTFTVGTGDVVVFPAGVAHGSMDSTLGPCEICAVHIDLTQLEPEFQEVGDRVHEAIQFSDRDAFGRIIQQIVEEHENPRPISQGVCFSHARVLIAGIDGRIAKRSTHPTDTLVHRAQRLLKDSFPKDASVDDVAAKLGVSSGYLRRRFLSEVGLPPAEWLRLNWLADARRLLIHESVPISCVADELGFASSQYFATFFKRGTGLTPKEYRERQAEFRRSKLKGKIAIADF